MATDRPDSGGRAPSPEISIIIAMLNPGVHLDRLLPQLAALEAGFDHEVILVDDGSTDGSLARLEAAVAAQPRWHLVRLNENHGAGRARDIGQMQATGRYLYFFDADDRLDLDGLRALLDTAVAAQADIALAPYRKAPGFDAEPRPMGRPDGEIWEHLRAAAPGGTFRLRDCPEVLALTPFVWVRLLRRDFAASSDFRHSANPLIDDMLPHWLGLLTARRLAWSGLPVSTHIDTPDPGRMSNTDDARRFYAFDAADEVAAAVAALGRRVPGQTALLWRARLAAVFSGLNRIGPAHRPEYRRRVRAYLATISWREARAFRKIAPPWQLRHFERLSPPRPHPIRRALQTGRRLLRPAGRA